MSPKKKAFRDFLFPGRPCNSIWTVSYTVYFTKEQIICCLLYTSKMDFSLMLDQLTAIAGSQAAEKNIDFRMDISLDRDLSLMGDSLRVSQIINNLLSNAFKFTPPGGRVELRVRETEVRENIHWMQFSVKDSGCGIRKENLEKIFRPFEQEGSKTAKTYGGTGLGLAISRRLAELMGGRITVESRPGEGSLFTVEIPFREAEASEAVLQGAQHNTCLLYTSSLFSRDYE